MKPSRVLFEAIQDLLAADTATLAAIAAMKMKLVAVNFNPGLDLELGALVFATFTGSAAKDLGIGTANVFYDATTGERKIELLPPTGGYNWLCTATPGSPETIYGYVITDNAETQLLGSSLIPAPITISVAGQGFDIAPPQLTFPLNVPY